MIEPRVCVCVCVCVGELMERMEMSLEGGGWVRLGEV